MISYDVCLSEKVNQWFWFARETKPNSKLVYFPKEHLYYFAGLNTTLKRNIKYTKSVLQHWCHLLLEQAGDSPSTVPAVQPEGEGKAGEKVSGDLLEQTAPDPSGALKLNYKIK